MDQGSEYLLHYGVKGMKWGVRRYVNADGTLTSAGKSRNKATQDSDRRLMSRLKDPTDYDGYTELKREIDTKSGNFYWGEPVSKRFKKALAEVEKIYEDMYLMDDYQKKMDLQERIKHKIAGVVLKDLGYENTAKARKFLIDSRVIFYD